MAIFDYVQRMKGQIKESLHYRAIERKADKIADRDADKRYRAVLRKEKVNVAEQRAIRKIHSREERKKKVSDAPGKYFAYLKQKRAAEAKQPRKPHPFFG